MKISAGNNWFALLAASGRTGGGAVRESTNLAVTGGDTELDTVVLRGSSLLTQQPLILPSMKNMRAMAAALSADLAGAFREAGIPAQPPVDIRVDNASGRIEVSGGRPDAQQIEDRLNGDEKLAESIRTTLAIGSHAFGMQRSLAFQREYLSSDDPRAVVGKYGDLFGARGNDEIVLRFDGGSPSASLHNIRYRK